MSDIQDIADTELDELHVDLSKHNVVEPHHPWTRHVGGAVGRCLGSSRWYAKYMYVGDGTPCWEVWGTVFGTELPFPPTPGVYLRPSVY